MLTALVALVLLQPAWHVDFTGKAGFGHVTRVVAMKDRLVFLDSPPPTHSDGGDIYLWRDKDARPTKVFSVQEQGVRIIRQVGRNLIVPGIDAMENWDWGNLGDPAFGELRPDAGVPAFRRPLPSAVVLPRRAGPGLGQVGDREIGQLGN